MNKRNTKKNNIHKQNPENAYLRLLADISEKRKSSVSHQMNFTILRKTKRLQTIENVYRLQGHSPLNFLDFSS